MSAPRPDEPSPSARRLLKAAGLAALGVLGVLVVLYLARAPIAAFVIERYLAAKGIDSSVTFLRLDRRAIDAKIRLGSQLTPDFTVQRLHVALGGGGLIPGIRAIDLTRPLLRITYADGRFSFGALKPLVGALLAELPKAAGGPAPRLIFHQAMVVLTADAGIVSATGDGAIADGRLQRLSASIAPAQLYGASFAADLQGGHIEARDAGGKTDLNLALRLASVVLHDNSDLVLGRADASLAISGFAWRKGRVIIGRALATIRTRALSDGNTGAADSNIVFVAHDLDGGMGNGVFQLAGPANAVFHFSGAAMKDFSAKSVIAKLSTPTLRIAYGASGMHASAPFAAEVDVHAGAYGIAAHPLAVRTLHADLNGAANLPPSGFSARIAGEIDGHVTMTPADARALAKTVPVLAGDRKIRRAIATALRDMTLDVPDIRFDYTPDVFAVALGDTATVSGASGAYATLSQADDGLVTRDDTGQWSGGGVVKLSGGGLPSLRLNVPQFEIQPDGAAQANLALALRANVPPYRQMSLLMRGALQNKNGVLTFVPGACTPFGLGAYASHGDAVLSAVKGRFCANTGAPLLTYTRGAWQLAGRYSVASARLDQVDAVVTAMSGTLALNGTPSLDTGSVTVGARLSDAKSTARFVPLAVSGRLDLSGGVWHGHLRMATANGRRKLAAITIRHAMTSGHGSAIIDARNLVFAPGGLQPGDLSSLMGGLHAATGQASFTGQIRWTAKRETSGGTFDLRNLSFTSPMGAVKQVSSHIRFTSLAPLTTADAQTLSAVSVDWLLPLSDLSIRFALTAQGFHLDAARTDIAGGTAALGPLTVAYDPEATTRGTLTLNQVNLGALVDAWNLSDSVALDETVSGAIPFTFGPTGFRFENGRLGSIGPGRLSIKRRVWTGPAPLAVPDAIHDFAYQAMEHLAIDEMSMTLNSLPNGRLGVIFHIKGRNDPAVAQDARVGVIALLQGRAFDKPIPLPKGTPVDLTLDTSLNFDDLLNAYRSVFTSGTLATLP